VKDGRAPLALLPLAPADERRTGGRRQAQGEFHLHLFLLLWFASPADVLERRSDSLLPSSTPIGQGLLLVDGYIGGGYCYINAGDDICSGGSQ
jgi:hypothetical protein